eukprot:COSAG06_NODE_10389_length_1689_cov_3.245912_2_plen_68_part_01
MYTMKSDYGQAILSLCVSDRNKALLLTCEVFIPLLVDSLLLDPALPAAWDIRTAYPECIWAKTIIDQG